MLPTGKPFYMWFLPVAKKKRFLDAVRPYLIIKKREPLFTVAA